MVIFKVVSIDPESIGFMNMSLAKLAAKAAKHGALAIALATSESSDLEWPSFGSPQHAVQRRLESRIIRVNDLRENSRGRFVRLVNDVHVELGGVHAQRFVKFRSGVIVQVHGDVHGQAKESTPQLGFRVVQEFRPRFQDGGEEVAVSVFVLAPVFKVLEDRVQLIVRVRCKCL